MKKIILLGAMSVLLADTLFAMEAQKSGASKIEAQNNEGLVACISELPQELKRKIVSLCLQSKIAEKYRLFNGIDANCISLVFSDDSTTVLTSSGSNKVCLWDLDTGKVLKEFTGHTRLLASVAFSPEGNVLAGSYSPKVVLWDLETGNQLQQVSFGTNDISNLIANSQWNSIGNISCYLESPHSREEFKWFMGEPESVSWIVFSPDAKTVVILYDSNIARLWDVKTGRKLQQFTVHDITETPQVAFSPDGKTVLIGSNGPAFLWDVETGKERQKFIGHTKDITSVAFSPDGKTVLTGSFDKTARLWDVTTGQELQQFTEHTEAVTSVAFSPDGKAILTGSTDTTVFLWDVETGKELQKIQCDYSILSGVFSPDGTTIALRMTGGYLSIFRRGIQLKEGTPLFLEMKQEAYTLFKEKELYHVLLKGSTETTKKSQSS